MARTSFEIDVHQADVLSERMHIAARDFAPGVKAAMRKSAIEIRTDEQGAALALPATGVIHTGLRRSISNAVIYKDISNRSVIGYDVYVEESRVRGRLAAATNRQRGWRHPVFGDRLNWVQQIMEPGWWNRAARPGLQHVRKNVTAVLKDSANTITKG